MIYFRNDYSLGAHPQVLDALIKTNMEHADGYGNDTFSQETAAMIRQLIGKPDAHVHFMVGGTPSNTITIAAALRPYEGVISADTGHIYVHETGSVEATGHRIFAVATEEGKLQPQDIEQVLLLHEDEHTVIPRLVYISLPTENGGIYTREELLALRQCCLRNNLYLYIDGARLGTALTCERADFTLRDVADLCDAFYIGGTKLGAMFGEALILLEPQIQHNFRYMIKRHLGLLAKGRLISIQMKALLEGGEDSLYYCLGRQENQLAMKLAQGIAGAGYHFWIPPCTNQLFVILPDPLVEELEENFFFHRWKKYDERRTVVRLVIGWGSTEEDVSAFLKAL